MREKIQNAAVTWKLPYQIAANRSVNDYNLLNNVTVAFYAVGYANGVTAGYKTQARQEDEAVALICQSLHDDMPIEEAKIRIKAYFEEHHGQDLDYGDLREALSIALPIIVEACDQLEAEGKIAGVD